MSETEMSDLHLGQIPFLCVAHIKAKNKGQNTNSIPPTTNKMVKSDIYFYFSLPENYISNKDTMNNHTLHFLKNFKY
ncbi:MAG: hypothetical protein ABSE95_14200 [Thermodesulfobacteriota bacterium]|jgi:hypothetical protein